MKETVQTPLEKQHEKDKHGDSVDMSGKKKKSKKSSKASKNENESTEYLYWTDIFGEEEILALLAKEGFKDCTSDLCLQSIVEEKERVGPPCQLVEIGFKLIVIMCEQEKRELLAAVRRL